MVCKMLKIRHDFHLFIKNEMKQFGCFHWRLSCQMACGKLNASFASEWIHDVIVLFCRLAIPHKHAQVQLALKTKPSNSPVFDNCHGKSWFKFKMWFVAADQHPKSKLDTTQQHRCQIAKLSNVVNPQCGKLVNHSSILTIFTCLWFTKQLIRNHKVEYHQIKMTTMWNPPLSPQRRKWTFETVEHGGRTVLTALHHHSFSNSFHCSYRMKALPVFYSKVNDFATLGMLCKYPRRILSMRAVSLHLKICRLGLFWSYCHVAFLALTSSTLWPSRVLIIAEKRSKSSLWLFTFLSLLLDFFSFGWRSIALFVIDLDCLSCCCRVRNSSDSMFCSISLSLLPCNISEKLLETVVKNWFCLEKWVLGFGDVVMPLFFVPWVLPNPTVHLPRIRVWMVQSSWHCNSSCKRPAFTLSTEFRTSRASLHSGPCIGLSLSSMGSLSLRNIVDCYKLLVFASSPMTSHLNKPFWLLRTWACHIEEKNLTKSWENSMVPMLYK